MVHAAENNKCKIPIGNGNSEEGGAHAHTHTHNAGQQEWYGVHTAHATKLKFLKSLHRIPLTICVYFI